MIELYKSSKRIALFPGWSAAEGETGYSRFACPLEINGVIEADFMLHGGAYKYHPDRHVTFELRIGKPGIKRKVPIARIDWRSLTGGHSNKRGPNVPWAGKRVGDSHVHGFEINWVEAEDRMRTDLSQAEPMPPEVQSFEALRTFAGNLFRISNIDIVEQPDWEYTLL
ncbi:hypothetical protein [Sphingomonas pokkalii]|uniref:hypothetical protein n=1 Tax=Sphingomonas pokkalii TaxID=2175090 RepID=UPI001403C824|nr:hypothetical protein [Sphingomonas pokkalii]